eukprot:14797536-Ditylum_brightwellii.AAC.1
MISKSNNIMLPCFWKKISSDIDSIGDSTFNEEDQSIMDAFIPDQNDQQNNCQEHLAGNVYAYNSNGGGVNDHPNQHAQTLMEPFDNYLSNNPVFCNARLTEVSLAKLEENNAVHQQLMFKYIDLQII